MLKKANHNLRSQPEPIPLHSKKCSKCGEDKELKEFYQKGFTADGRDGICIACAVKATKERNKKKREEAKKFKMF